MQHQLSKSKLTFSSCSFRRALTGWPDFDLKPFKTTGPAAKAAHGWLLGSKDFVDRIRQEMKSPRFADEVPQARLLNSVDMESVFAAVIRYYKVEREILSRRGDGHIARAVAAWLARRLTSAILRELSVPLWLGRPEHVNNLTLQSTGTSRSTPHREKIFARSNLA